MGVRFPITDSLHTPVERMLRDPDRREIEVDSHRARDTEQGRMEPAVSVDEQDIRPILKATHRLFDPRGLPVREVGGDVREVHGSPHGGDFDEVAIRKRDRGRDCIRFAAVVSEVDARDEFDLSSGVFRNDLSAQFELLVPQDAEEIDCFQRLNEMARVDKAARESEPFANECSLGLGHDRPTVRAHHAMTWWEVGMLRDPG